jgi:hypothetical protein
MYAWRDRLPSLSSCTKTDINYVAIHSRRPFGLVVLRLRPATRYVVAVQSRHSESGRRPAVFAAFALNDLSAVGSRAPEAWPQKDGHQEKQLLGHLTLMLRCVFLRVAAIANYSSSSD